MNCGGEGRGVGGTSFVVHQLGGKVYCIQLFCYGMFSLWTGFLGVHFILIFKVLYVTYKVHKYALRKIARSSFDPSIENKSECHVYINCNIMFYNK